MKYIYKITILSLLSIFILSCNKDYLDTPPDHLIDASDFFKTEMQLESYINGLYDLLQGQAAYEDDASSDNIIPLIVSARVRGTRIVPVNSGSGGWNWGSLRRINFFLDNYEKCPDENARLHYGGMAKFFRAYFYYLKVKRFGDVPWYEHVLKAGSDELYIPRDDRKLVMDKVLNDIDDAIANIPEKVELNRITKYTALILKARICLFEGTFRKYHGIADYERFLQEAASASEELINTSAYKLYSNGDVNSSYRELFDLVSQNSTETILARNYNGDFIYHNIGNLATSATNGSFGMPKDLIDSYLLKNGNKFTDVPNYDKIEYYDEMQNRDPRLTQTTAGPNFTAYEGSKPELVNLNVTTTGYRVIKAISSKDQWSNRRSVNDIILFRYAEALLVFAESKAELGTITQTDLDKSINKLRDRVGMPHLMLADANANPDPFLENQYTNVDKGANKGVILEIRRERRIELFMEGQRWDDLMRWKEGKKLEQPMVGIYFSKLGGHDFTGNGVVDVYLHDNNASGAPAGTPTIIDINKRKLSNRTSGNLIPFDEVVKFDEDKDYYYPIPSEEFILNKNLKQNPKW